MKTQKRKTKRKLKKKVKRGVYTIVILTILVGIALNSNQFKGYKDEVYAQLKEEISSVEPYLEETALEEVAEESVKELTTVAEKVGVKNYKLTVDTDLRTPSNATAEDINAMLKNTELKGLGEIFVQAEKQYGVNALYMVGLACLESGWGTSDFAKYRNNLYGWNAVDSNPGKATTFSSKEESTLYVASKLQKNYLTEGGAYFEGYSARAIDVHYCTDPEHADKIVNIVSNLVKKID